MLVLGSKPESQIPHFNPTAIYAANGAYARIPALLFEDPSIYKTLVFAPLSFEHHFNRAISTKANRIVLRKIRPETETLITHIPPTIATMQSTLSDQWHFQLRQLGLCLYLAEAAYYPRRFDRIKRLAKLIIRRKPALGLSTGLFAALLAAYEHPEAPILLAGIGVQPGGHFYETDEKTHGNRACVDRFMMKRLPQHLKMRLQTTDPELSGISGIPLV